MRGQVPQLETDVIARPAHAIEHDVSRDAADKDDEVLLLLLPPPPLLLLVLLVLLVLELLAQPESSMSLEPGTARGGGSKSCVRAHRGRG